MLMAQEGFITQATDRSPAGVAETQKRAKEAGLNIECIESQITNTAISTNNIPEQLKELKELYKSGDLTKEEYKKAKKKVLD